MLKPNYRVCIKRRIVSYAYVEVFAANIGDAVAAARHDFDVDQMSDDKFGKKTVWTIVVDAWPKNGEVTD